MAWGEGSWGELAFGEGTAATPVTRSMVIPMAWELGFSRRWQSPAAEWLVALAGQGSAQVAARRDFGQAAPVAIEMLLRRTTDSAAALPIAWQAATATVIRPGTWPLEWAARLLSARHADVSWQRQLAQALASPVDWAGAAAIILLGQLPLETSRQATAAAQVQAGSSRLLSSHTILPADAVLFISALGKATVSSAASGISARAAVAIDFLAVRSGAGLAPFARGLFADPHGRMALEIISTVQPVIAMGHLPVDWRRPTVRDAQILAERLVSAVVGGTGLPEILETRNVQLSRAMIDVLSLAQVAALLQIDSLGTREAIAPAVSPVDWRAELVLVLPDLPIEALQQGLSSSRSIIVERLAMMSAAVPARLDLQGRRAFIPGNKYVIAGRPRGY